MRVVVPALTLSFSLAAFSITGVAHAADVVSGSAGANPAEFSAQLAPIVITATKRQTTVQTTPISIVAVTAADIASRGITELDSLVQSVPGLSVRTFGPGQTEFEMRGLNSSGGDTSMVGLYLDDIPLSSPLFGQLGRTTIDPDLYDLNRVEVLRGPQGTLYGSSSMGGTIRLIPNAPQLNTYEASAEEVLSNTTSGGNINHQENGMLNLPLGDNAAVRVVGSFTRTSGWIKRLVIADGAVPVDPGVYPEVSRPGNFYTAPLQEALDGVNTTDVDSIRADLLWKPMENLTVEPMAMYELTQQGGPNEVDVNGDPTHPETPTVEAHYEPFDTPEPQQDSFSFGSVKAVYQFPSFSLTSATGLFHRNLLVSQDGTEEIAAAVGIPTYDGAAGGLGPTGPEINGSGGVEQDSTRQLSEEFRVVSTAPGPLQWVGGYFYQDLHSDWGLSVGNPEATPILGGPVDLDVIQPQVLTQNAFFGDASWRFSPHFMVSAGLRHYHYSVAESLVEFGAFSVYGAEGNSVPFNSAASIGASGTVPSATMTYNMDSDHMVYARVTKGFRLGGVNQPIPADATSSNLLVVGNECGLQAKILLSTSCNPDIHLQAPVTFGSDWVWSYELGEKSSFLDGRMTADADVYWETWLSPQLATNLAGYGLTANGGNARIRGFEGQLQALLAGGFDISLNAAYTDASFTQSSAIIGFPEGTEVPDTPKISASAVLRWRHDLSDSLSAFGSLEEDYVGARTDAPYGETITLDNINQFLVHLPGYSMINLRFGIRGERSDGAQWTAALFVDNLTNNHVLLDPQPQISVQLAAFQRETISQPLTAGVDLTYRFY